MMKNKIIKAIGVAIISVALFITVIGAFLYFAPPSDNYSFGGLNATQKRISQ